MPTRARPEMWGLACADSHHPQHYALSRRADLFWAMDAIARAKADPQLSRRIYRDFSDTKEEAALDWRIAEFVPAGAKAIARAPTARGSERAGALYKGGRPETNPLKATRRRYPAAFSHSPPRQYRCLTARSFSEPECGEEYENVAPDEPALGRIRRRFRRCRAGSTLPPASSISALTPAVALFAWLPPR